MDDELTLLCTNNLLNDNLFNKIINCQNNNRDYTTLIK